MLCWGIHLDPTVVPVWMLLAFLHPFQICFRRASPLPMGDCPPALGRRWWSVTLAPGDRVGVILDCQESHLWAVAKEGQVSALQRISMNGYRERGGE